MQIRRASERGHANHGWLDTYHTFSFAHYYDPAHMGHGSLRVINQDRVAPAQGFGSHGHRDMEIVSYVLDGVLEHKDSMGNGSQIVPGDVQLMSAGTGVTHSEFNGSREAEVQFLQMWVIPAAQGVAPRYEQKHFPVEERRGRLRLVVSPDAADGSLQIGQHARLYAGLLDASETIDHTARSAKAWLHLARGELELNGEHLRPGDGVGFDEPTELALRAGKNAEFVLWELG